MDIHKPKPWHGLREFLKEYLIIVVGVLTALGAEQVVEWAHRGAEVREARVVLQRGIRGNLRTLALEARENQCWEGALAATQAWAEGKGPRPVWPGALMQSVSTTVWDVAKTSAVPHMDLDERLGMAGFYGNMDNQLTLILVQRQYGKALLGYLNRTSLDPEEAHALIRLVGEIRANLSAESLNIPPIVARAHKRGIDPGPPDPEFEARVDRLCAAFPTHPAGTH